MTFKVVESFIIPGFDNYAGLLKNMDAVFISGHWKTEDELVSNLKDSDAVLGTATFQPFTRRVLGTLTKCRIIASSGIGLDQADLEAATEYGIAITNVPDYGLDEVSGRAIAFMFALGHKLFRLDNMVRTKRLSGVLNMGAVKEIVRPMFRMRDQTLGIIGLGRIGTAAALKARGLGMRVVACDPYVLPGVMESRGVKPVDLETLIKESDFISLHTILTEETHNMIGSEEFKKMKPTCYFINTARGGCVDQPALIHALQQGLIAGAGLDVTAEEPIAADNPLLKMDNVILTGHTAGYSVSADPDLFSRPMIQVVKALNGEWPDCAANPQVRKKWLEKWGKK
jgi:D-3-phosphoglycerate dehydrogenase / 2-oxoglutarate reductase